MKFNGKTMTVFADFNMSAECAVLYTEQNLTYEQKIQARKNIGAWGNGDSLLHLCGETQDEQVIISAKGTTGDRIPVLRFDEAQTENAPVLRGISDGVEEQDAATFGQLTKAVGYIETALDSILAIQNELIGGDA